MLKACSKLNQNLKPWNLRTFAAGSENGKMPVNIGSAAN